MTYRSDWWRPRWRDPTRRPDRRRPLADREERVEIRDAMSEDRARGRLDSLPPWPFDKGQTENQ